MVNFSLEAVLLDIKILPSNSAYGLSLLIRRYRLEDGRREVGNSPYSIGDDKCEYYSGKTKSGGNTDQTKVRGSRNNLCHYYRWSGRSKYNGPLLSPKKARTVLSTSYKDEDIDWER
jgi:hypothetical protein